MEIVRNGLLLIESEDNVVGDRIVYALKEKLLDILDDVTISFYGYNRAPKVGEICNLLGRLLMGETITIKENGEIV